MAAPRHFVKIGVAPYDDGSGYQATVVADDDDGEISFRIEVVHKLEACHWPELRDAVERALALIKGGRK